MFLAQFDGPQKSKFLSWNMYVLERILVLGDQFAERRASGKKKNMKMWVIEQMKRCEDLSPLWLEGRGRKQCVSGYQQGILDQIQ